MFKAQIFDVCDPDNEELIGTITIDDETREMVELDTEVDYEDALAEAIADNLDELIDLHDVLLEDPEADDTLGVELDTDEQHIVSVLLVNDED